MTFAKFSICCNMGTRVRRSLCGAVQALKFQGHIYIYYYRIRLYVVFLDARFVVAHTHTHDRACNGVGILYAYMFNPRGWQDFSAMTPTQT